MDALKATGITRRIDDLGRIVLPKELRKTLGIEPGTPIEIYTEDDTIVLTGGLPVGIAGTTNIVKVQTL